MAGFAFFAHSLQQISTLVITLLAARFLAPAEYGVYAIGLVFITLIQTLTFTGFYQFVINSKAEDRKVLSISFWLIVGLVGAAALALSVLAYPLAWAFDAPDLGPVLILMALVQPVAGAGAWASAVLLRRQRVELHFAIMFAQNAVALVGGVVLLWAWQSLYALVAFRYLRVLSGAVLYLLLTRDRPGLVRDRGLTREALGFSGGLYGARLMNFLSRYSADLLLGLLFSTAEAGLYRFGNRLAGGAIDVVRQPIRSFALTQFGAAGREDRDLAPVLERFTGTLTLLTGGVGAVVSVFAAPGMAVLFDPAYLAALSVVYAMALRGVVGSVLFIEPAFAAQGRTGAVLWFSTLWAGLTVAAVFVSAQFGLEVLAWSMAAVTSAMILSGLAVIRRAGIRVGGALRALCVALGLVAAYGIVLHLTWQGIADLFATGAGLRLCVGLIWATVLAGPVLLVGHWARVFTLRVFSG